ncbi:McrC family protein [Robiginitalea sp. SC105]|uniref:McrC family protein n=1 Tax=Robiginitalea sp. SC105 TaxID=2762332 RepID=UPI002102C195|nr:McrC family protein [Robiginitalea sp. SC105]
MEALLRLNEFHNGKYFEPIAKGLKFKQYVGVIQVDGLSIEIHPKADKNDPDRKWKGVLLKMLQSCGKLKAQSAGPAHVNKQHLNLLEVYFEMFLGELEDLIRKGFVKKYRKRTANQKALRGKLEFAGHLQRNLIHKERFYTTHEVYDPEHLLHQILLKALDIVDQFSMGSRLSDVCKRILFSFPEIERRSISVSKLESITLNRKTRAYENALQLAILIIKNHSPDISHGQERMLSLLFDMNQLWEEYILKSLHRDTRGTGIKVNGQESKPFWRYNYLKPDIVIRKGGKTFIIDTKWKQPHNGTPSVSDLRQMYAYCRFWNADKALLLYPGKHVEKSFNPYRTDDFFEVTESITRVNHQCKMGFVSVFKTESDELDPEIGKRVLELLEID